MASAAPDVTENNQPTSKVNKRIALLIGILALLLAFSEIGGKNAEQDALARNIEASNLWADRKSTRLNSSHT